MNPSLYMKWIAVTGALAMMIGCAPEDETESGIMALELIGVGDDSAADGALEGSGRSHGRFIELARQCAPEAPIETIDACGRSVPGNANLEWSNCTVALPVGARASELVSSGRFDMSASLSGSCDDGTAVLSRTATFAVDASPAEGVSMHIDGTSSVTRQANGSQTISIDVSRSFSRGDTSADGSVSGELSVSADANGGRRILNGPISFSMNHPRFGSRSGTVTLENVVRVTREECKWPVGGTMTRAHGDESKVIEFSETCGQATIDGEAVDLDDQAASVGGRPGGGRGGRRPS